MKVLAYLGIGTLFYFIFFVWFPAWRKWRKEVRLWRLGKLEELKEYEGKLKEEEEYRDRTFRQWQSDFREDLDKRETIMKRERRQYKKKVEDLNLDEMMETKFDMTRMSPAEVSKLLHEKMVGQKQVAGIVAEKTQEKGFEVVVPKDMSIIPIPPVEIVEDPEVLKDLRPMLEPERFCGTCKEFKPGMRWCALPLKPSFKRIMPDSKGCSFWNETKE